MALITAVLILEGNAVNVLADAARMRDARSRRRARITARVLVIGPGREHGFREEYQLPEIVDGDASAAIETVGQLARQARISPVEEQQLADIIARFVDATR